MFTVKIIKYTNLTTYLLQDDKNQDIQGGFYQKQKVKYPDVYLAKKILRKKG